MNSTEKNIQVCVCTINGALLPIPKHFWKNMWVYSVVLYCLGWYMHLYK